MIISTSGRFFALNAALFLSNHCSEGFNVRKLVRDVSTSASPDLARDDTISDNGGRKLSASAFTVDSLNDDATVSVTLRQVEFGDATKCGSEGTNAHKAQHFFAVYMNIDSEMTCDYHSNADACLASTLVIACDPSTNQASVDLYIRDELYSPTDKIDNPSVGICLSDQPVLGKSKSWAATFDCATPSTEPPTAAPTEGFVLSSNNEGPDGAGPGETCEVTEDCIEGHMCVTQSGQGWRKLQGYYSPEGMNGPMGQMGAPYYDGPGGTPPPEGMNGPTGQMSAPYYGGPGGSPPFDPYDDSTQQKVCKPYLEENSVCGIFPGEANCHAAKQLFCGTPVDACMGPTDMVGGICVKHAGSCNDDADCDASTHFCGIPGKCLALRKENECCSEDNKCLPGLECLENSDFAGFNGPVFMCM